MMEMRKAETGRETRPVLGAVWMAMGTAGMVFLTWDVLLAPSQGISWRGAMFFLLGLPTVLAAVANGWGLRTGWKWAIPATLYVSVLWVIVTLTLGWSLALSQTGLPLLLGMLLATGVAAYSFWTALGPTAVVRRLAIVVGGLTAGLVGSGSAAGLVIAAAAAFSETVGFVIGTAVMYAVPAAVTLGTILVQRWVTGPGRGEDARTFLK